MAEYGKRPEPPATPEPTVNPAAGKKKRWEDLTPSEKKQGIGCAVVVVAILGGCVGLCSSVETETEWDAVKAQVYCANEIKKKLRDPDSYRFVSALVTRTEGAKNQFGSAVINYRAKNGFGGYVSGVASCKYWGEGEKSYIRVTLIP